jgi:hypothetical protein
MWQVLRRTLIAELVRHLSGAPTGRAGSPARQEAPPFGAPEPHIETGTRRAWPQRPGQTWQTLRSSTFTHPADARRSLRKPAMPARPHLSVAGLTNPRPSPPRSHRRPCCVHGQNRTPAGHLGQHSHTDQLLCTSPCHQNRSDRAAHSGGSARVINNLCSPVGGRPASPPKSQTKGQRRPTSGDTQLRQATIKAGQVPTERHRATSSDTENVTGGQGVAGSNPAVPTGNHAFSNIITPHKSQQKSQLVVQRPPRGARRSGATASLRGMCQHGRAD